MLSWSLYPLYLSSVSTLANSSPAELITTSNNTIRLLVIRTSSNQLLLQRLIHILKCHQWISLIPFSGVSLQHLTYISTTIGQEDVFSHILALTNDELRSLSHWYVGRNNGHGPSRLRLWTSPLSPILVGQSNTNTKETIVQRSLSGEEHTFFSLTTTKTWRSDLERWLSLFVTEKSIGNQGWQRSCLDGLLSTELSRGKWNKWS